MALTMNSAYGKWKELRDELNKKIASMMSTGKDWKKYENIWLAFNLGKLKRPGSNAELANFVMNVFGSEIDDAMGNVVKGKWARRVEMFGKAADNLKYVDLALSGYTAATSTAQLSKTYSEQKTNKSVLKETIEQYAQDTKYTDAAGEYHIPARVGLQYIESSCRATVLNELKFESELINAINSYVDVALAVCAVIPATAPLLAFYATVKTVYEIGKAPVDMVVNGYYLMDRLFYHSVAADLKKMQKKQSDHHNVAIANLFLLREDMSENISNQYLESYRIRAHAIHGLYGLMTRAAMDVLTKEGIEDFTPEQKVKEYKKLCESKYHLASYIQNFLLNDVWSYNHNSWVPINMDTWWTYASNLKNPKFEVGSEKLNYFGVDSKTLKLFRIKKREAKKELNDYGFFAGIRYLYHEVGSGLPDIQKADFQRYFPIHFMSSGNFEEFSKQYENIRVELDHNSIAYSAMYYREWNEKKDSDWKLMKDKWLPSKYWFDSVSAISPLTQVRVLVVLQKDLQFPYPISLQVNRIDFNDINGPVYSGFCRKLTSKDILAVDKQAQQYKDGYHGYVFYPFYQLENVSIPGIKPLAGEFAMLYGLGHGVDVYYRNGHLTDMEYRLVVILAKRDSTQQSVKINKDHDYFTLTVNEQKEYDFKDNKGKLVTPKPRYEKAFIDYDFLKARGQQMVYSEILKNPHITCLMRLINKEGTTPYFGINQAFDLEHIALNNDRFEDIEMQMQAKNMFLKIKNFDWNSSVEFMFVVTCPEISINKESENLAKSKKEKIGWRAIPFKIEMGSYRPILANYTGPTLNSTLHYLGEWSYDKFDKKEYASYEIFKPLVKQFEDIQYKGTKSEQDDSYKYLQKRTLSRYKDAQSYIDNEIKDSSKQKKIYDGLKWNYFVRRHIPKAHVFAAHVKLSYESLRGKTIHGLRPFGDMPDKGEFFDFVFNSASTAANAGISNDMVSGASITAQNFTQFRVLFSAPTDYTGKDTAPWILADPNNKSRDVPVGMVFKSEVKDWIENRSTVLVHPYTKKKI
ncbi:hypothetical protein MNBD_GAMMA22-2042 [hydrothermal vent metagenome]|uniref:Uncharacterized protein n=1 Tax=hydrothermal vent metagenome TaxID=652676 RepID=A0A3B1ANU5_9ZZZZ